MNQTSQSSSQKHDEEYEANITLSYEYTEKSIKEIQDANNYINTQLGLLIGFNLTFIRFFLNSLPNSTYSLDSLPCNSCWLLKLLAYGFSITSIVSCFLGLYKTIDYYIIKPNILVQNCDRTSKIELKLAILDTWKIKLDNFIELIKYKKRLFNYSIVFLGISGLMGILDKIIISTFY
ncbi:MAG: hypothetical protein RLZZ381_1643 [Cyanobacteriota bacterium]|jgi:hypothetical protein